MRNKDYDFGGWATRNNLECADGLTIREGAFKDCDGKIVPLVWNHQHDSNKNVLGHALLETRPGEGVYAYCYLNDTEEGIRAKKQVANGDVTALSIYANKLRKKGNDLVHGMIREVSLVIAGANPGAFIDSIISHSDDSDGEWEGQIWANDFLSLDLSHADCKPETDPETKKEKESETKKEKESETKKEKTINEIIETMNEEQKIAMQAVVGAAVMDERNKQKERNKEDKNMAIEHNVFDQEDEKNDNDVLMHDALNAAIKDGKRYGSLKESFLAHANEYGIENIEWLFPDHRNLTDAPAFIKKNPDGWVSVVMNGVHHTPYSRIKMMFADLREDDARAKGYAKKAQLKKEEVFGLVKRTIDPTTVYKKQKLDRDDIIDITDFSIVSWIKAEMRTMLDEEIARAIVFGDGRSLSSPDKIDENKIIPIVKDADLYAIKVTPESNSGKDIIKAAVKGQNDYEGSGDTIMFVSNSVLTEMLLLEDLNQRRIYKDVTDLALACSVNRIIKVPNTIVPEEILGVIVDLNDYNVGADKGGSVNMFEDFDIDYNQEKYLIETRCSGGLTKPFSAVVIKKKTEGVAAG